MTSLPDEGRQRPPVPGTGTGTGAGSMPVPGDPARPWMLLLACCLGMFMSFIDVTATISTLNAIQNDLEVAPADLSWVSSTYTLVVAAGVLSGGALGEKFGLRRVFLIGVGCLVVGSLVVFTSDSFAQLLIGRGISGVGGALILPTSLAILVAAFVDESRRNMMIAIWATASGIGLAVGPLVGGLILEVSSWHSVYMTNAVLAVVTVAVTLYAVPETKIPGRPLDLAGQFLAISGLSCLIYGIAVGGRVGYGDPVVVVVLVIAAIALFLLVVVEANVATPMLDVRMMRSSAYSAALFVSAVGLFCFVGVMFLEVLFLQRVQDVDPVATGIRLLPAMASFVVGTAIAGGLSAKMNAAKLLLIGTVVAGASAIVLAQQQPESPVLLTTVGLVMLGLGSGFVVAPATAATISVVPPEQSSAASSAVTAFRQVGAVLGTATLGAVLAIRFIGDLPGRLSDAGVPDETAEAVVEVARAGGGGGPVPPQVEQAIDAAFTTGVQTGMWIIAVISFTGSLATALFLLRAPAPAAAPAAPVPPARQAG